MHHDYYTSLEKIIRDFIELRDISIQYEKRRNDLEKEYNKLLISQSGEDKNFTLDQADKIYSVYCEMLLYQERAKTAAESFIEVEQKLREVGNVLYDGTIHADINFPAVNGHEAHTRTVRVTYKNEQVQVH